MSYLFLRAIGIDDGGVIQMALQIAGDIVDIDTAQLVALYQFFLGQTFGLVLLGQFVDSGDDFVHIHSSYLIHSGGSPPKFFLFLYRLSCFCVLHRCVAELHAS